MEPLQNSTPHFNIKVVRSSTGTYPEFSIKNVTTEEQAVGFGKAAIAALDELMAELEVRIPTPEKPAKK